MTILCKHTQYDDNDWDPSNYMPFAGIQKRREAEDRRRVEREYRDDFLCVIFCIGLVVLAISSKGVWW